MTLTHVLLVLLLCVLTGSYTWGMRGSIIGGERGAMLPGAALALVLLYAGSSAPVAAAFPMAASIGAAGMFFGGSQTYGETIALTHASDQKKRLFGRFGLSLKGAGWFGVFGGVLGFGLGAMAGRYALWETGLFVLLLPVVQALGVLLFNSPHRPKEHVFPKLYFSESRRESWGGILLVFLYILIFAACKREWFVLCLGLFGFLFGAIGFFSGNLLQTFADTHLSETWISGWKAMECTFGAIGAIGIGLCWCLFYDPFGSRYAYEITAHSGTWTPFSDKSNTLLSFVWLVLLALFIARYWFPLPNGKKSGKISRILFGAEDIIIYPVFCLLPLFLASVGDLFFSRVFCFFGLFFLLADKIIFSRKTRYEKKPYTLILHGVLAFLTAALLFMQIFLNVLPGVYAVWTMYTLVYLLAMVAVKLDPFRLHALTRREGSFKKAFLSLGAEPTWLLYAGICVIALMILGKSYFTL